MKQLVSGTTSCFRKVLEKMKKGATPLTTVTTRDLHSRGQQHQDGRRDKIITNLCVGESRRDCIGLPPLSGSTGNEDQLDDLIGTTWPSMLAAATDGTNEAYASVNRPTATIHLPRIDEFTIGQLLQMLMLATVVEGRLVGTNPYGQPGVEAYKKVYDEEASSRWIIGVFKYFCLSNRGE